MQGSFRLDNIFGIDIDIHYTWLIVCPRLSASRDGYAERRSARAARRLGHHRRRDVRRSTRRHLRTRKATPRMKPPEPARAIPMATRFIRRRATIQVIAAKKLPKMPLNNPYNAARMIGFIVASVRLVTMKGANGMPSRAQLRSKAWTTTRAPPSSSLYAYRRFSAGVAGLC